MVLSFSFSADTVVALYLYLVKLLFLLSDVLFFSFFVVLPVMVNKDEYITYILIHLQQRSL